MGMIYRVWDKEFYESKSRYFAHDNEKHGEFFAENEDGLKDQLREKGLSPDDCRWELST